MKKLLGIILAIMVVAYVAGTSKADVLYSRASDQRIQSVTVAQSSTATLQSAVTTNNRVLGFTVSDSAAANCALFDVGSASGAGAGASEPSTSNVFAEAFVAAGGTQTIIFPLAKTISTGLVMKLSTSTGVCTVYYE